MRKTTRASGDAFETNFVKPRASTNRRDGNTSEPRPILKTTVDSTKWAVARAFTWCVNTLLPWRRGKQFDPKTNRAWCRRRDMRGEGYINESDTDVNIKLVEDSPAKLSLETMKGATLYKWSTGEHPQLTRHWVEWSLNVTPIFSFLSWQ